jgi:NADPH:quinone reductase-like Zn-dependent oxidoreductase
MRATVQDRYGDASMLRHEHIAMPEVGDNDVLVRVHAAGLDRGTWHLMTGKPYLMQVAGLGFAGPKDRVPGRDLAGAVAAVGAEGSGLEVGDEDSHRRPGLIDQRRPASPTEHQLAVMI